MAGYDKKKLLYYINAVSFAVDDSKLFLDTHPDNKEALEYFDNYNKARNRALNEYAACFGPLTIATAVCDRSYEWANQPWPWEMEG
ncbi:MAG: spore coat protein CotJB [Lachnospiraceae bacterium]|nr:spore coat protein CotJB [Lachnospiraceae bacterium]